MIARMRADLERSQRLSVLVGGLRHRLFSVKQLYEHDVGHSYADRIASRAVEDGRALPCVGDSSCGTTDRAG